MQRPAHWLEAQPEQRSALRHAGRRWTYGELHALTRRLAGVLGTLPGLSPGGRVAWLGHNAPEQLALFFACARRGLTLVPLNWRLTPTELAAILSEAGPGLMVVDAACAGLATPVVITACAGPVWSLQTLQAACDAASPDDTLRPAGEQPLLLVYTSGTTGRAKGTMLAESAVIANARNAHYMHQMTREDRVLTTLPMFHVGGLNIQTLPALALGAEVLLHERFEPAATLAALADAAPTLTVQVPATLQALLAHPAWPTTPLGSLRAITTGSTDVPVPLIEQLHVRGVPVIQVYGATETSPIAICQRPADAMGTLGAIGRPAPDTAIRLLTQDGREAGIDEPGEILVHGPQLASGYFCDPVTSAASFRDGWFHSGDVASRDAHGVYWFRDRVKNVIISGGENLYPAEIERVARRVPGIVECAVVGRPDPRWGQVPVMYVETGATLLDESALRAAFRAQLARYKHPAEIITLPALPRTALGKVDLSALRRQAHG